MPSTFFKNFSDNLIKILVFYDVKTIGLKDHLEEKMVNFKEKFAKALETKGDLVNVQLEDKDEETYEFTRSQAELFYQIAKFQTYENLIEFENKILLLFTYSEMEQYFFKTYRYLLLKNPEILKDKTITISKLLDKKTNFETLIEEKIEFVINELFFEDFTKIFRYAEKPLGLNLIISKEDYNELNKYRQIRNLYIHNDGIVNSIFLSKVIDCDMTVGEKYMISKDEIDRYEEKIRSVLLEFDKALVTSHPELKKAA